MEKLVYINCCLRKEESSTLRIANAVINVLKERYEIKEVDLNSLELDVIDYDKYHQRMGGYVREDIVNIAKDIASADRIVIAAPFWDMSFPSRLKVFFEQVSLFNITFTDDGVSGCHGLCKASKMLYITTRGGNYPTGSEFEQATPYLKALSHLWGIGGLEVVSAINLDYLKPEEKEKEVGFAIEFGQNLAKTF